jgi:hypothetical protein
VTDPGAFTELVEQLRTEVGAAAGGLLALLGQSPEMLLVEQQVHSRAVMWASCLLGDDDRLAAQTVTGLAGVLFPGSTGPAATWWRTPLGRAAARSGGYPGADVVSYSVAGAMLGYSKQYVGKLVAAGRLERGPSGGVTSASVRALLKAGAGQAAPRRAHSRQEQEGT